MITEAKEQAVKFFTEGRNHYKLMEFDQALQSFAKALKADPEDGPSKVYYARCKHYIENPPPEDWDGVFIMRNK